MSIRIVADPASESPLPNAIGQHPALAGEADRSLPENAAEIKRLRELPSNTQREGKDSEKSQDLEKQELAVPDAEGQSSAAVIKTEEEARPTNNTSHDVQTVNDTVAPSEHFSTVESTLDGSEDLKAAPLPPARPPLEKLAQKNPKPFDAGHVGITLAAPLIILFDLIVPIIIYYAWYNTQVRKHKEACRSQTPDGQRCTIEGPAQYNKAILGYAVISFGFGEVYVLVVRVWRLLQYRDLCAPLLSRSRWELDATSWVYLTAMLVALVPFVVGSSLVMPALYLYGPAFLMVFLLVVMALSMCGLRLPIGINSHARGSRTRPFVYYAAEDFIAVDGLQDREFRVRFNARYDASPAFRRMFVHLTLWWMAGILVYVGCLSAIIWCLEFHYAFGLSFGLLFAYIILWAIATYAYVGWSMHRQKIAWQNSPLGA